jgi:Spy/CpxP family protein refolding chaperone
MLTRSKLMAVGLLAAVAVAGFAAGAATVSYASDSGKQHRHERNERWSYSGMLQQELGLTDAQRDTVRAIVRRHRPEMRAVYESVQPRLDSIQTNLRAEISAMLTAEQQHQYEALTARLAAERAQRVRNDSARRRD